MRIPAIVSILLALAPAPLFAQNTDWKLECKEALCSTSRALISVSDGKQIATFLATTNSADKTVGVGLALPLGVALEDGIRMVVGDKMIAIPMQVCFPDGCRAFRALTADELALLGSADSVQFRFFAYGQEKPIAIDMELTGFSEAIAQAVN